MVKALIVAVEIDAWFVLSGVLRQNQIKTNFVNSLSAARQSLQKDAPGMLFFDSQVQEGCSANFIKYVRSAYPGIKIVMIKGRDGGAAEESDLFISKPFNTGIIIEAIKKIL